MNEICSRCNNQITKLNLSDEDKIETWGLLQTGFKLFAIDKIKTKLGLSLTQSKLISNHLNSEFGECINCQSEIPKEENIECKTCKAFNYNLTFNTPFNKEFCSHLEYSLDFDNLENEDVKGFWCDGIYNIPIDPKELLIKNLEKSKSITTRAHIGKGGQDHYILKIIFGMKSFHNYKSGLSLINCIPKEIDYKDWIKIDPKSKKVEVILN